MTPKAAMVTKYEIQEGGEGEPVEEAYGLSGLVA